MALFVGEEAWKSRSCAPLSVKKLKQQAAAGICLMQPIAAETISPQVLDYIRGELTVQTCMYGSALSFIKGFVLGQLSVIIVIVLALRYLLMEDVKRVKKVIVDNDSRDSAGVALNGKTNNRDTFPLDFQAHHRRVLMLRQQVNYRQPISAPKRTMILCTIHQKVQIG